MVEVDKLFIADTNMSGNRKVDSKLIYKNAYVIVAFKLESFLDFIKLWVEPEEDSILLVLKNLF